MHFEKLNIRNKYVWKIVQGTECFFFQLEIECRRRMRENLNIHYKK